MIPESEHGHHHHHGTGVKWLDLIVAVSAIFMSVVSLVVSIKHGKTMEEMVNENQKMVAANTITVAEYPRKRDRSDDEQACASAHS